MLRCLFLFFFLLTLTKGQLAAADIPAQLGRLTQVRIPLPAPGVELAGLPDLGQLMLFRPVEMGDKIMVLSLLPLQPGRHELPDFSFQQGTRHWLASAPTLLVRDDLPADLKLAPLRTLAQKPSALPLPLHILWFILPVAFLLLRHKQKGIRAESEHGPTHLETIQRQLEDLPASKRQTMLLRLVKGWRFSPFPPDESARALLAKEIATLREKA